MGGGAAETVRQLGGVLAEARRWEGGAAVRCIALQLTWGGWMGLTEQTGQVSPRPPCSGDQQLHTPQSTHFFFSGEPRMRRANLALFHPDSRPYLSTLTAVHTFPP